MATKTTKRNPLVAVNADEFVSGEMVAPGTYIDMQTGSKVTICEADTLPDGVRVERYVRRFQRVEQAKSSQDTLQRAA